MEEITEVCRLCLKSENLIWIFDKRFESSENMKDVIFITTGVQVDLKDMISQKICKKCLQIAIKIFQFRATSLKNDEYLKEKYSKLLRNADTPLTSSSKELKKADKHSRFIHPSVESLIKKSPSLLLPKKSLHLDIDPSVELPMDEVENYFKQHNRNIQKHIHDVLKALRLDNRGHDLSKPVDKKEKTENTIDEDKESIKNKSVVPPINIKLNKEEYSITKKEDSKKDESIKEELKKDKVKSDLKRKPDSNERTSDPSTSKKKKTSESSENMEKNASIISSLGLTPSPKKFKKESDSLMQVSYVQRTLEICNICNSVQYSLKDLRRHQLKHLACQFCKTKFKTMQLKHEHLRENCIVKKTMNGLPTIDITKIEYDVAIRRKYHRAFVTFPPLPGIVQNTEVEETVKDEDVCDNKNKVDKHIAAENNTNTSIIEILSDDDEPNSENTNVKKNISDIQVISTDFSGALPSLALETISNPLEHRNGTTASRNPQFSCTTNNPDLFLNSSSSIVKPDIKIKNNYVLDEFDPRASDMVVLKELLKNYKKIPLTKDVAVQPDLPTNASIKTNMNDYTAIFKNLKHQLLIYRIPVDVKHGSYRVSFDYNPRKKTVGKMNGWNSLIPTDLRMPIPKSATISNDDSSFNQQNVPSNSSCLLPIPSCYTAKINLPNVSNLSKNKSITNIIPSKYNGLLSSTPTNISITNQNNIRQPSESVAFQNVVSVANTSLTVNSSDLYKNNNQLLAQILYPTNQSPVIVTPQSNYVSYNSNNALYNSSTSVVIPHPQVFATSAPAFASNPFINTSSVPSSSTLSTSSQVVASHASLTTGVSALTNSLIQSSQLDPTASTLYTNPQTSVSTLSTIPQTSVSTLYTAPQTSVSTLYTTPQTSVSTLYTTPQTSVSTLYTTPQPSVSTALTETTASQNLLTALPNYLSNEERNTLTRSVQNGSTSTSTHRQPLAPSMPLIRVKDLKELLELT